MSYIINKFNGTQLVVLEDGTVDTSTSLGLVGRNYVGYGETQNENYVFLLENFANDAPPSRPIEGQSWFNTSNDLLHVYDGANWVVVGSATLSATPPETPAQGRLWLRSTDNVLNVWDGSTWRFIGPETATGFGTTRARSTTLLDTASTARPVILFTINDVVIAIGSATPFTINPSDSVSGFLELGSGITLNSLMAVRGNLQGIADRAQRLEIARKINGVNFDGTSDISIKASTTNSLVSGDYVSGSNFDGSTSVTWDIDASSANLSGKVVARNTAGGFSAGMIAADLTGDVIGNVTAASGTSSFDIVTANQFVGPVLSGNAFTATRFETARTINGITFDGSTNVTVPASAETLTGTYIKNTVLDSNLRTVGVLNSAEIADAGVIIGGGGQLRLLVETGRPTIRSTTGLLNFDMGATGPDVSFVDSATSVALGGPLAPAIIGDNTTNLGIAGYKFDNVYANRFRGLADTATASVTATNIAGGSPGSVPYQSASSTTALLAPGTPGQVIKATGSGTLSWVDTAITPTANTLALRDASGNLSANYFVGVATAAQYADLAEYYTSDQEYEAGTVLIFGGDAEVTTTSMLEDQRVAGVVTTNPAYVMNSELEGTRACVALQGRVPVKVLGMVRKGGLLTTSNTPGCAISTFNPKIGTIIGKALESKDTAGEGIIEVAVGRM